jgi:hypothetical protein
LVFEDLGPKGRLDFRSFRMRVISPGTPTHGNKHA